MTYSEMSICALRVSRLVNGVPDHNNVSGAWCAEGIGQVAYTVDVVAGDDVAEKDGCGQLQVVRKYQDLERRATISAIDFLSSDPRLMELMFELSTITLGGEVIGVIHQARTGCTGASPREGVCVEAWSENWDCTSLNSRWPYRRTIFPKATLRYNGKTMQSGLIRLHAEGFGEANNAIGSGPAQDFPATLTSAKNWFAAEFFDDDLPTCGPDETGAQTYQRLSSLSS